MSFTCDQCDEETPTAHGLAIHKGKKHGTTKAGPVRRGPPGRGTNGRFAPGTATLTEDPPDTDGPTIDEASPYAPTSPGESAPKEVAAGWRERLWGADKGPSKPKRAPSERRPRTRRVSTEGIWVTGFTGVGLGLVRSGADVPVGNCLQFQAPIVGEILDDAVAGTAFDTVVLQRLAGSGERFKKVSSVLAMPILVALLERNPGAAPVIEPLLRQIIREHLVAMVPVIKARQRADENYRKALTELGVDSGDDPIDAVIDAIFPTITHPEGNGAGTYNPTTAPH